MRSLVDDVESLCVVRECCELEIYFGTNFTDTVLFDATVGRGRHPFLCVSFGYILDFLEPFLLCILLLFSCIWCNIVLMGINYF